MDTVISENTNTHHSGFVSSQLFKRTDYIHRKNTWAYEPAIARTRYTSLYQKDPDFVVSAQHCEGDQPFTEVIFEVFVSGRISNEEFPLEYSDVVALRDMFSEIASNMKPEENED